MATRMKLITLARGTLVVTLTIIFVRKISIVESIFLGLQAVINCSLFVVFLVSHKYVKGVHQSVKQRPKFGSRKNQFQSKKKNFLLV